MSRRGHVLLLMMLMLVAFTTLGLAVFARHSVSWQARHSDALRRQALWLARSAAQPGAPASPELETALGRARISVIAGPLGAAARVELEGAVAEAGRDLTGKWFERYRAP